MKKKAGAPNLDIKEIVKKQKKLFIDLQTVLMLKAITPYLNSKAKTKDVQKSIKTEFNRLFHNSAIYSVTTNKKNSI